MVLLNHIQGYFNALINYHFSDIITKNDYFAKDNSYISIVDNHSIYIVVWMQFLCLHLIYAIDTYLEIIKFGPERRHSSSHTG